MSSSMRNHTARYDYHCQENTYDCYQNTSKLAAVPTVAAMQAVRSGTAAHNGITYITEVVISAITEVVITSAAPAPKS